MELTVGPLQFFWNPETWRAFYRGLERQPVERVVLGEAICSKRAPFNAPDIPEAVERLTEANIEVMLTSLALITLKRERKAMAELAEAGGLVEINDLTMLRYLPENADFAVGPMVNVFNEGTLGWLAGRGMRRICLPPELPLAAIRPLAETGRDHGVAVEVWGWGRAPLAISGRCYHARLHDRSKDNCQFVCEEDPDGRAVDDLDGKPFLAVNGVQTLSQSYVTVAGGLAALAEAGVSALRLSPHSCDFAAVIAAFRDAVDGSLHEDDLADSLRAAAPGRALSNGFLSGRPGVEMV